MTRKIRDVIVLAITKLTTKSAYADATRRRRCGGFAVIGRKFRFSTGSVKFAHAVAVVAELVAGRLPLTMQWREHRCFNCLSVQQ
ncbi:hypothetical protein EVAR_6081_1 [Eumeta japonica]|uniref:Uncharacterized protein n=1 Tax=Eumeta variegata TaxID=151549 RepID=A0A4C1TH57_EUMVA|nr:hypothetical protein EVAR_6081_1 [Eumeta japonica]